MVLFMPYLILSWWGLSVSMTILSSSEMSSLCASNITTIRSALAVVPQNTTHRNERWSLN